MTQEPRGRPLSRRAALALPALLLPALSRTSPALAQQGESRAAAAS
ncbi:hypothetical protein ACFQU7_29725 [Pseudoroseomonas wenyumeiae]